MSSRIAPPDHLAGNEERGQAGDPTEDAEGDRLRLERPLRPRQDVGRLDVGEGHSLGQHSAEVGLNGPVVTALQPTLECDPAEHVVDATGEEFVGECGCEELDLTTGGPVLVLEQAVQVDGTDADQLHLDLLRPWHLEVDGVVPLGVADPADSHRLAQM